MQRSTFSIASMCSRKKPMIVSSSAMRGGGFCRFLTEPCSSSSSNSRSSILTVTASTVEFIQSRASSLAFSLGSLCTLLMPLIFDSRSQTLNRSMSRSIERRATMSGSLSLISAPAIHDLICSRSRCSFLISFLSSPSNFSRWLGFSQSCTWFQRSSKMSWPSTTFFNVRSISALSLRSAAMPAFSARRAAQTACWLKNQ
mmetsp:Transcript_23293/g.69183  ORF Transcript_23293/g.69183 Transcript_23293/m.69183 type:complete len:200 (-) Transcript_23293:174-773(-)